MRLDSWTASTPNTATETYSKEQEIYIRIMLMIMTIVATETYSKEQTQLCEDIADDNDNCEGLKGG